MRITLTLDHDVAMKLKRLARRSGRAFRDVVNETLRYGLLRNSTPPKPHGFKVEDKAKTKGEVTLVKENGAWKIDKENWSSWQFNRPAGSPSD